MTNRLTEAEWKSAACNLCFSNCGIKVQIGGESNRHIVRVRGDKNHPASRGYTYQRAERTLAESRRLNACWPRSVMRPVTSSRVRPDVNCHHFTCPHFTHKSGTGPQWQVYGSPQSCALFIV